MKAKRKELATLAVADLLKEAELSATEKMYPPAKKGGGLILEGDLGDLVDRLLGILKVQTTVFR